jgi:uncharacterized membrane protein YccC
VDTAAVRHALKTALAAALSMYFCYLLELPQGYWAVITVVIVMQSHSGGSIGVAWSRLLGTLSGAAIGVVMVMLFGREIWPMGLSIFISVFAAIYLSRYHDSFRLAAITASIVIMIGGANPLAAGVSRLLEITVGIAIALMVSLFLWPSKAGDALIRGISGVFDRSAELFQVLTQCLMAAECDDVKIAELRVKLNGEIQSNTSLFAHYLREPGRFSVQAFEFSTILEAQRRIYEILVSMGHSSMGAERDGFQREFIAEIAAMADAIVEAFHMLTAAISANAGDKHFPELTAAAAAIDNRRLELRKTNEALKHSIDDVAHFIAFSFSLKELAVELNALRKYLQIPE